MKAIETNIKLNNGVEMPQIGYGSYKVTDEQMGYEAIKYAIEHGYRLIDTAEIYGNQSLIAKAIKDSGKSREELFLTSKIWNANQAHDKTIASVNEMLEIFDTDYLDLVLVHWPAKHGIECYQALEELYEAKKIRAIGVSNFTIKDLEELLKVAKVVPTVNQVEMHPLLPQLEMKKFLEEHDIVLESWRTMMGGADAQKVPYLTTLATKYGVDNASICLKWAVQQGVIVLPKSNTPSRIASNVDSLDKFTLTNEEIKTINELGPELRLGPDPDVLDR